MYRARQLRMAPQHLSDSKSFTIAVAAPFAICTAAVVKDLAAGTEYTCVLTTMTWSPSAPQVRPGAANLYILFQVRNIAGAGNLTLTIKDDTGATLKTETKMAGSVGSAQQFVTTEVTVDMPDRNYGITVSVTP